MPIKSRAQQGWMFANKPAMAKRWAAETPNMADLPEYVGDSDTHKKVGKAIAKGKKKRKK